MEKKHDTPVTYSIGEATKKAGLSSRQIRYYEETGLLKPIRTQGKHRRYTEGNIETLLLIKELLKENPNIEAVKSALQKQKTASAALEEDMLKLSSRKQELTSLYPVSNRAELAALIANLKEIK
jgi:MerR family glutamine synthetase transcriptional repressor